MSGTYDKNAKYDKKEIPPGSKVRVILSELYDNKHKHLDIEKLFPVDEIMKAMMYYQGDGIPG